MAGAVMAAERVFPRDSTPRPPVGLGLVLMADNYGGPLVADYVPEVLEPCGPIAGGGVLEVRDGSRREGAYRLLLGVLPAVDVKAWWTRQDAERGLVVVH